MSETLKSKELQSAGETPGVPRPELAEPFGSVATLSTIEVATIVNAAPNSAIMGVRRTASGELDWSSAATVTLIPRDQRDVGQADRKRGIRETQTVQTRLESAVEEIKGEPVAKTTYSLEMAEQERPFTHYTEAGNIFQILRFGLQSGNFKNRVNAMRGSDSSLNDIAPQMSGLRYRKGGSYQGEDSISLGMYDTRTVHSHDLVLLIDPAAKVFGLDPKERDTSTGYGHGIVAKDEGGDFAIGNPTAYQAEVLAANVVPPSEIKGLVLNKRTSIISSLRDLTRNNAALYSQAKLKNPAMAKEDLLANSRLIAALSGSPEATTNVDELSEQIDTIPASELAKSLNTLQKYLLQEFVGKDAELNEASLRETLEAKFQIKFLSGDYETITSPES